MWRKWQVSPAKRFKRMQILYQTSPLSGVRAVVWLQEVETSTSVGTQKRRAVLLEKKHRLFQNPNAHILLLFTTWHQSHETVSIWGKRVGSRRIYCQEEEVNIRHVFCASMREENVEIYDVFTLSTGLFHKSESGSVSGFEEISENWQEHKFITCTTIITLHKLRAENSSSDFFVIPCLGCLQSLGYTSAISVAIHLHTRHSKWTQNNCYRWMSFSNCFNFGTYKHPGMIYLSNHSITKLTNLL